MLLMGVPLAPSQVLELADLLDDERLAAQLRSAHERHVIAFALAPDEAEGILSVLHDPPAGFEELRSVLFRETEPRRAAGLQAARDRRAEDTAERTSGDPTPTPIGPFNSIDSVTNMKRRVPAPWIDCPACGWRHYPATDAGRWHIATSCRGCGASLGPAAVE
jgi:hypothetical protein